MQLGPVLDTTIGVVLVYVVLSLLLTTLVEIIAALTNSRGKALLAAIATLTKEIPDIEGAFGSPVGVGAHPLVVGHRAGPDEKHPSYVDALNFAKAVLDHLGAYAAMAPAVDPVTRVQAVEARIVALGKPFLTRTFMPLIVTATKIEDLEVSVAKWFDNAMDRLSGQYKRRSQAVSIALGLTIAVVFNASSINIGYQLWGDTNLRDAMVQTAAAERLPASTPASDVGAAIKDFKTAQDKVAQVNLPLGWGDKDWRALGLETAPAKSLTSGDIAVGWFDLIAGCLMTGLALSLGAPFWFDVLQKLINLRNTGPKPAKAKKKS